MDSYADHNILCISHAHTTRCWVAPTRQSLTQIQQRLLISLSETVFQFLWTPHDDRKGGTMAR